MNRGGAWWASKLTDPCDEQAIRNGSHETIEYITRVWIKESRLGYVVLAHPSLRSPCANLPVYTKRTNYIVLQSTQGVVSRIYGTIIERLLLSVAKTWKFSEDRSNLTTSPLPRGLVNTHLNTLRNPRNTLSFKQILLKTPHVQYISFMHYRVRT
jgi:hypothetical protein